MSGLEEQKDCQISEETKKQSYIWETVKGTTKQPEQERRDPKDKATAQKTKK